MVYRVPVVVLLMALTIMRPQVAVAGVTRELALPWVDIARLIVGSWAQLTLTDGTRLRVFVRSADAVEARVDIQGTSNRKVHPRGSTGVPASLITLVRPLNSRFRSPRDSDAAAIGAGIGTAAAAPIAFYLGEAKDAPDVVGLLVVAGGATLGVLIARHFQAPTIVYRVAS